MGSFGIFLITSRGSAGFISSTVARSRALLIGFASRVQLVYTQRSGF